MCIRTCKCLSKVASCLTKTFICAGVCCWCLCRSKEQPQQPMRIQKRTEQIALPSKNLLEDSIKLCQLTVSSENQIRKALKDGKFGFLSRVKLINVFGVDDQVQAAHYKFGMDSAIVFRGSESAPNFLHHNKSKKFEFIELKNSAGRVMVHGAMLEEWRQVSKLVHSSIQDWVRDNPQSRVFVLGHSIGAGLAELQSLYSQTHLQIGSRLECITFGAPRVGNKSFKREFDDIIDHCYRIVNDHDIVPGMSSSLYHVGQIVHFRLSKVCDRYFRKSHIMFSSFSEAQHHDDAYLRAISTWDGKVWRL